MDDFANHINGNDWSRGGRGTVLVAQETVVGVGLHGVAKFGLQ